MSQEGEIAAIICRCSGKIQLEVVINLGAEPNFLYVYVISAWAFISQHSNDHSLPPNNSNLGLPDITDMNEMIDCRPLARSI